ncbi:hypothetical protein AAC387_Pa07g0137 [Persea americana]
MTRDYMLIYDSDELNPAGYTDSDFKSDKDSRKSTSGYVLILGGGAISWRSIKQECTVDSTLEAKYVAACKAAKEAVWLQRFLLELGVVHLSRQPLTVHCDSSRAIAQSTGPRSHKRQKHIQRKYHLVREIVQRGDTVITKIAYADNLADPFTKPLTTKVFEQHLEEMGIRCNPDWH